MSDQSLIAPAASAVNKNGQPAITKKLLRGSPSEGGVISATIGTGDNAKNSIVWITIRWTLFLGGLTSLALYLQPTYCSAEYPGQLVNDIKATWSIFMPVVTLALGYIFGRSK